jgi:hypothetical protein
LNRVFVAERRAGFLGVDVQALLEDDGPPLSHPRLSTAPRHKWDTE